ncbi:lactate racemase domain-containing protein [soil metagenome]
MNYPNMVPIRQSFERTRLDNIPEAVRSELGKIGLNQIIKPGQTVALTAGSRGIANIPAILKSTIQFLGDLGARPFIVPAMGSHGGATAEGQVQLLESYGISEATMGVPILSSMETVSLGSTSEGYPIFLDKHASEADHIAVIGRIKPHTGFHGPIESGLLKMMMIGLGKHQGALYYHRLLLDLPYQQVVRSVGRVVRERAKITFGLGIVENAYDETALIRAVLPADFEPVEEELLTKARKWLPQLPFRQADLLIVDEIGKNISGSGMDTNVVGRKRAHRHDSTSGQPDFRLIYVRSLSEKTHGNATGLGLADFTRKSVVDALNYKATVINCLTAGYPEGADIPVHFDSDREILEAALMIIGLRQPHEARILHIRNTLQIEKMEISEPCLQETERVTDFQVTGEPRPINFNAAGNIADLQGH